MKKILFEGSGTALATPFDKNNQVNLAEFTKLINFQIQNKTDALIVCGTTGESSTMTKEEKISLIKCAINTSKNSSHPIPIIVGTGSNSTSTAIEMSQLAENLGADGLLIVTPYYNKTTQAGLIKHYLEIAKNVSIPIILYNVPSRTGVNIEPQTCLELSKQENIVAIKEASGNISQVLEIASLCGEDLNIYSGNDDQILPILSVGGIGVISVLSNIKPEFTHNLVYEFLSGNISKSQEMQQKALPLIKALFSEVNPIPVKETLNLIGFDFGEPRLPLTKFTENNKKKIEEILNNFSY